MVEKNVKDVKKLIDKLKHLLPDTISFS